MKIFNLQFFWEISLMTFYLLLNRDRLYEPSSKLCPSKHSEALGLGGGSNTNMRSMCRGADVDSIWEKSFLEIDPILFAAAT